MAVASVAYEVEGWGVGEVWLADGLVVWHELPQRAAPVATGARGRDPLARRVVRTLRAYFAGELESLAQVAVDLEYDSSFYTRCALALRAVPRGEVVTYGELAALAGSPGAARAAGSFCARNRLALFVPCHRVVAAEGLGAYGSLGLDYKRRLLELEGAALR